MAFEPSKIELLNKKRAILRIALLYEKGFIKLIHLNGHHIRHHLIYL